MKLVYFYDHSGYYQGSGPANLDPLESDRWLLPANSTFTGPSVQLAEHQIPQWDGYEWKAVVDPFYQAELDRRAAAAQQQAEIDAMKARQVLLDEYTKFQSVGHYAIYALTGSPDNEVLAVVGAYHLRKDVDDVPMFNGVALDDDTNDQYGYLGLATNDQEFLSTFRNKYNVSVKKVVGGALMDRDPALVKQLSATKALAAFKNERGGRLQETDWAVLPDAPISADMKAKVLQYRQQLRNLPAETVDPENPKWPTNPLS